jgi:hypothetical protein
MRWQAKASRQKRRRSSREQEWSLPPSSSFCGSASWTIREIRQSNALSTAVSLYVLLRAWKPPRRFPTQTLPLLARLPSRAGGADSRGQHIHLQGELQSQRTAPNPALGGGIETCSCSPSEPSRSSAVGSCSIVAVLDRSSSSSSASSRCCRLFRRPIARRGCRKSER